MTTRNSFTFALSQQQQRDLRDLLAGGNYRPLPPPPHAVASAEGEGFNVTLYGSGKCLVQGKQAADFVTFVLEPAVLKQATLGYEHVLDPASRQPHMGIDESGKGDFFGPLVIAAAYADEQLAPAMEQLDVKDSKKFSSDARLIKVATELRKLLRNRFVIVSIGPRAYNRLHASMRNLNRMLAWGHARAIENLLEIIPGCPRAVSDQFGNKSQLERALLGKGRSIELVQRHRAESDIAVAAASVLARAAFLDALKRMKEQYGMDIPKGASQAVREAARKLLERHGTAALSAATKCHFVITDEVLGNAGLDRSALEETAPANLEKPEEAPDGEGHSPA